MDLRIRRSLAMYVWLLEEEYDAPEMTQMMAVT